ncbi:MAG: DUF4190 domain-containing protein [Kofleriaceae bacterium]
MTEQRFYEPQQGQQGYGQPPVSRGNGLAVAGLVTGILGLLMCFIPFLGWILALLGIIFGAVGVNKANKGASGKGLAMAGLITGSIGLILGVAIFVWAVGEAKVHIRQEIERDKEMQESFKRAAEETYKPAAEQ